jgi:hypothetical protein
MGNLDAVTITAESGVFTASGPRVEVALLPDTTHYLEVEARVKEIWREGCRYGGYTLRAERDKNRSRLVIQQGQPAPPAAPGSAIAPGNVSLLRPWFSVAPDARSTEDFCFGSSTELIGVGYADKITRWDMTTGQEAGRIGEALEEAAALCVTLGPDGDLLATGGIAGDGTVRLWDRLTGEMVKEVGRHDSYVISVAFDPTGSRLASGDTVNHVRVWDLTTGQGFVSFEGDVPNRSQAFHDLHWPNDNTLIAAGSDAIYRWDVTTGQLVERLGRPAEAEFFVDATFSQNGDRLACAAQDDKVHFWDRKAAGWAAWPAQDGARLSHVEFSPDGQLLAATTFDGQLLLWDVEATELLGSHHLATAGIAAVRFSPDGRYLAVGGYESAIWLWAVP